MQMAEVLLAAGSDPNAVSSDGRRPYELDLQVFKIALIRIAGLRASQDSFFLCLAIHLMKVTRILSQPKLPPKLFRWFLP